MEAAAARGVQPDHVSFRALCDVFGDSNAMVETIREAEKRLRARTETLSFQGSDEFFHGFHPDMAGVSLRKSYSGSIFSSDGHCSVEIDLHNMGAPEAKVRRFEHAFVDFLNCQRMLPSVSSLFIRLCPRPT